MPDPMRWGVLGTANIAAKAFLPALREAGGVATVVGSRSENRGQTWAAENGVTRAGTYESVVAADDVDAVYVALPNDQHSVWAAAALAAGKAVLCEKPIALNAAQAEHLVAAVGPDDLLWESFVFAFHPQTTLLERLVAEGRIGDLTEIVSEFHFDITGATGNIRLSRELGGGALYDVGCYPLRLARHLFGSEPVHAATALTPSPGGVELDMAAVVDFPQSRRLIMSAGMRRPMSTFTRIVGTTGELRVTNPFHPTARDTVELWVGREHVETWPAASGSAFRHAIDHINAVILGQATAQHTAVQDAVQQARSLDLVRAAATTGEAR
ncbi:Gfo/Idh/MocA family protein [Humibacillus sp. DSM 29435]|uniref:Gfo/Idh/MocA family protein n=1 Tax=Humibacillus sp. DSM 29435 TaxID=1869167 RepID=UPI0009F5E871|nr:Gfo/Idh/MocA family oxidoreductase [Humibacillus sp. DSM 29435]